MNFETEALQALHERSETRYEIRTILGPHQRFRWHPSIFAGQGLGHFTFTKRATCCNESWRANELSQVKRVQFDTMYWLFEYLPHFEYLMALLYICTLHRLLCHIDLLLV